MQTVISITVASLGHFYSFNLVTRILVLPYGRPVSFVILQGRYGDSEISVPRYLNGGLNFVSLINTLLDLDQTLYRFLLRCKSIVGVSFPI